MVAVMRVDIAPLKQFIGLIIISVFILVIAIIVGATGPKEFDSVTKYAYECANNNHTWSGSCSGKQLANNDTWWFTTIPPVTALNRFWTLQFMPYTLQSGQVTRDLQLEVNVSGQNDPPNPDNIPSPLYTRYTTETVACDSDGCTSIVLVDEQELDYTYYSVQLRFLNGGQLPGDTVPFLGDVRFVIWTGHSGFSSLELALRIVFLFIGAAVLGVYLFRLRTTPMDEWAWEQRALLVLFLGQLALNNPFFGLRYVSKGWFFHFLDALFTITFLSLFLAFGLLVLDKLRLEEVRMQLGRRHLPKFLVVLVFAILGVTLFAWVDIRDSFDPILGHPKLLSGIEILFYIEATVYAGILIWLAVLVVMTIPVATSKPYIMTRFLFVSIPTSFCIIAILIGIFNGTFGPLNESTLSMVFFLTLYNEYVWVLATGFWPVQERFGARNPSEADTIIRFDDTNN